MFDLPEAKRVRRSDLHSDSSRSASPGIDGHDASSRQDQAAHAALASFFSSHFDMSQQLVESETKESTSKSSTAESSRIGSKKKGKKKKPERQEQPTSKYAATADVAMTSEASSSSESDDEASGSAGTEARSKTSTSAKQDESNEAAPEYAFRLFAGPAAQSTQSNDISTAAAKSIPNTTTGESTIQKITLDPSITADPLDSQARKSGGFLAPRPRSHYIAEPWSESQRAECAAIAITPEMLAKEATRSWAGCTKPWRVVRVIRVSKKAKGKLDRWSDSGDSRTSGKNNTATIDNSSTPKSDSSTNPSERIEATLLSADGTPLTDRAVSGVIVRKGRAKGGRPGKKRRLVLRQRVKQRAEAKEAQKAAEEEKAKEKTRRNREKKVRRKMKLREKEKEKAGQAVEGGAEGSGDGGAVVTAAARGVTRVVAEE